MGWAARNETLRDTARVNRDLSRIQMLMKGVSSVYQLDAMLRREIPHSAEDRASVRKLLMPFLEQQLCRNRNK